MAPNGYGWRANLNPQAFGIISNDDLNTPTAHAGDASREAGGTLLWGSVAHKVCSALAEALSSGSELQAPPKQVYRQLQQPYQKQQMSITTEHSSTEEVRTSTPAVPDQTNSEPNTPICGCLGCHDPAVAVIDHPRHGERVVCDRHAEGHEVIGDV